MKLDSKFFWAMAGLAVTFLGNIIANKGQEAEMKTMKEEIRQDILRDLLK